MAIISSKMIDLMNYRIQQEENSSRIYLAMSLWLGNMGYTGAEKVWKEYSDEELTHAQWAYDYLLNLNVIPVVPELDTPKGEFKGLPQIIAMSYQHEIMITDQVKALAKAAQEEGDFMLFELALKYCNEQQNELNKTQLWIDKLESFGTDKIALKLLDNEMAG